MTTDKIIKKLEYISWLYGILGENERAINEAIEIVRKAGEAERNDPLTLDELREMKGEPVYTTRNGWRICYGVTDFTGELHMETGAGSRIPLRDYGKKWLAYRRPPEEGEQYETC